MAEKVGDVYVTVHADNSRLRNELKAQAAKDGKAYGSEFDKALADEFNKTAAKNRQRLAKAFATGDFSDFKKEMGSVAEAVKKVDAEVLHLISSNQISMKQAREVQKALKSWEVSEKLKSDLNRVKVDVSKVHDEALSMERAMRRSGKTISTSLDDIHAEALKIERGFRIAEARAKKFGTSLRKGGEDGASGLRRMIPLVDAVTAKVAKIFGSGARNNFVNIVGRLIGGMTQLFTAPLKVLPAMIDGTLSLSDGFKQMAANIGEAEKNVSGLAAAFGEMVLKNINPEGLVVIGVTIAAVAATIGTATAAIFAALNIASAAVSVLAGMLLSLASAAAFAIAGGLLPLVPVFLSLAGPLGLLVGLMQDFNKTAKQQPKWVGQIKDAWKASTGEIDKAKGRVGKALGSFFPTLTGIWNPLVSASADAMSAIIKNLTGILKQPGMRRFISQFQTALPKIFTSLGLGINQALSGLIAFFAPILPFAERLAKAFQNLMTDFNNWASSARGQNQISDFMDKAWAAASKLWDILKQLAITIGIVFGAGQQNGQDFLDTLDGLLTKFNEWLKSPEGQTALHDFFVDAKSAAERLWGIVTTLFNVFDNLDTSTSRAALNLLLTSIEEVAHAFGGMLQAGTDMATFLWPVIRAFVSGSILAFAGLVRAAADAFSWVPGLGPKLQEAADQVTVFAADAEADLAAMDTTIQVTADTAKALQNIHGLSGALDSIPDNVYTTFHIKTEGTVPKPGQGAGYGVVAPKTKGASGMLLNGPMSILAGEAGPEALVPLNRPLALVDPAVRALSAIAQGKTSMASGGVVGMGKSINVAEGAIVVNTSSANPTHVAMSVLDRLTAAAI